MCQFVRNRRVFSFGTAFAQALLPAAENGAVGESWMAGNITKIKANKLIN